MDCDMLVLDDIKRLYDSGSNSHAVSVVKHEYTPSTKTKFLGQVQSDYPKKNWSSVMIFNCGHPDCLELTPKTINTMPGSWLHQFEWTGLVAGMSPKWNYLVGEGQLIEDPKIIHWTIGGPWFKEYYGCEYTKEWIEERDKALESGDEERVQNVRREGVSQIKTERHPHSKPFYGTAE